MEKVGYSKTAILNTYKNAHIALQSLSNILPETKDKELKKELHAQYEGYNSFISDFEEYMKKKRIKAEDINFFKKAMLFSSIKISTLFNNSKNKIAELMIKGTMTGINELIAMKNEGQNLPEETLLYIEKLLNLEEKYQDKLKNYL